MSKIVFKECYTAGGVTTPQQPTNGMTYVKKVDFEVHKINPSTHKNLHVDGGAIS